MKMLTIGIDGGDERIIRAMPMPNLHNVLNQNICLDIEEDLWSRGWVKILSGVPGYESGAFYAKPKLDGTHDTTQKFSQMDYDSNPTINPLWKRLSNDGYRVGFMNVPSMMPTPELNGFAVAGGGAGASTSGSAAIPRQACNPPDLVEFLNSIGYVLDLRIISSGIRDIDELFRRLLDMTRLRTDAFLRLQRRFNAQFCFVAYMALCRVQYFAMSEIDAFIQNDCAPTSLFQEKIVNFYAQVDEQIGRLIAGLSPKHVMLVSDHSQSPRLYSVNINDWLIQAGFQFPPRQGVNLIKKTAKTIAGFLPRQLKKQINSSAPRLKTKIRGMNVDWEKTSAFGLRYVPGIYINDDKRFSGPVNSIEKADKLIKDVIASFNASEQASEHNLKAVEYRNKYKNSRCQALLPDIWVDHSDTYFFEQHGRFVEPNRDFGPIESLESVTRDMFTGIKGRYPLLCVDPYLADLIQEDDQRDLTLAYKIIVRGMHK
jgi:predicted AlkP superfamily phosphohydrolase/phosphomutase